MAFLATGKSQDQTHNPAPYTALRVTAIGIMHHQTDALAVSKVCEEILHCLAVAGIYTHLHCIAACQQGAAYRNTKFLSP